jgi:hypothetical protein
MLIDRPGGGPEFKLPPLERAVLYQSGAALEKMDSSAP